MADLSVRIYRLLLLAYPAAFRQEYGSLMMQAFRDDLREARRGSLRAQFVFWLRMMADLVHNVMGEQMNAQNFSQKPGFYLRLLPGILAAGATWPLLLCALIFGLLMTADPSGSPGLAAQPTARILIPMLILGGSSLIMARASLGRREDRGLPWRFALINLIASAVLLMAMAGSQRLLPQLLPTSASVSLILVYGLLVAGLLYVQHRAARAGRPEQAALHLS